jgi:hypothetical protein
MMNLKIGMMNLKIKQEDTAQRHPWVEGQWWAKDISHKNS